MSGRLGSAPVDNGAEQAFGLSDLRRWSWTQAYSSVTFSDVQQHSWSVVSLWVGLVLAGALVLGACGDDAEPAANDDVTDDESPSDGSSGDGGEIAGSVDDADLLVPRDYLQGEWCDSDGQTWTIDGDTTRLEDASGGVGEFPVDFAFIDGPEETLVSQTDDQFVVMLAGDEITFSRGRC